jgi:CopG antitoxin of type II toxin-antitoxin system
MTVRGRPSKGDRVVTITTRLPAEVREEIDRIAGNRGVSVSQIVADLVSRALGREDLVLDLTQEVLPMTAA